MAEPLGHEPTPPTSPRPAPPPDRRLGCAVHRAVRRHKRAARFRARSGAGDEDVLVRGQDQHDAADAIGRDLLDDPRPGEPVVTTALAETRTSFPCFGGRVTIIASVGARDLIPMRALLETWHRRLTRFDPESELSRLNHDPREQVPVSPIMACFVAAAIEAADRTDGLVDPTLVGEIEAAGYTGDLGDPAGLELERVAAARPAAPSPERRWLEVHVD